MEAFKNMEKKAPVETGEMCPNCSSPLVIKQSKYGKFTACSNYPECDFVSWSKPTGELCDECGSYLVEKPTKSDVKIVCSNKDCKKDKNSEK